MDELRAQFDSAEFHDFCTCGCNSFAVRIPSGAAVKPIASAGHTGLAFEADFAMRAEGETLEVMLFADEYGNLSYIEIDCCPNSVLVPVTIEVGEPFHVHNSERLLP